MQQCHILYHGCHLHLLEVKNFGAISFKDYSQYRILPHTLSYFTKIKKKTEKIGSWEGSLITVLQNYVINDSISVRLHNTESWPSTVTIQYAIINLVFLYLFLIHLLLWRIQHFDQSNFCLLFDTEELVHW